MARTDTGREVAATCRALAEWRRDHGGRGRAIPDALWGRAVEAARTTGVGEAARALKLDRRRLQARVAAKARTGGVAADDRFVEVTGLTMLPGGPSAATVVELVGRDGERVRVEVAGDARGVDLAGLARAFWSRGT